VSSHSPSQYSPLPRAPIRRVCLSGPVDPDAHGSLYAAPLLILGSGTGSELHHPRAVTLVGSVIVSRQVTLPTTLITRLGFDRLENLLRHSFGGGEAQPEGVGW
jgi:multidrug efflux pump